MSRVVSVLNPSLGRDDPPYRQQKSTQTIFQEKYDSGRKDFSQQSLIGIKLRGYDLVNFNFSQANLSLADLSGANLSGAELSDADLSKAKLLPLDRLKPKVSKGEKIDYEIANLSGANLSGANLSEADLGGAILRGANLSGANLSGTNLLGTKFIWAELYEANLSDSQIFKADLTRADLREANLSRAKLSFANLSKANLTGAKLYGADLREATLHDTKFENAYYDEQTQFPKTFDPEKNGLKKEWISSAPAVELTEVQSTHTTLSLQNPISVKPTEVQPSLVEKLNEKPIKGEQESADQLKAKGLNWQSKKEKRSKVPIRKTSRDELQENKDKADKIGLKGEVAVNAFLNKLQQKGQIDSYEWISDSNATSPYDFWVSIESQPKTLIDVKSTNGKFDNVIHISLSELQQMVYGDERYDIYRVFEIDETKQNC